MGGNAHKEHKEESYQSQDFSFFFKGMVTRSQIISIEKQYKIEELLGKGTFAQVYRAKSLASQQIRAIKKFDKTKLQGIANILNNQFQVLKDIDHPNIIKMYGLYEDAKYFYMVTELIKGKQLFDYFKEKQKLDQKQAFNIFYQVLLAVNHLHNNRIIHRDIKLQNIIFDPISGNLKLIDFGSAYQFDNDEPCTLKCVGTVTYIAPEVINKFYNKKCDNWSLGVFLHLLLSGLAPFAGKDQEQTFSNITNQPLSFAKPVWDKISQEAKKLISGLLEKDYRKRLSITEVLNHPWVKKFRSNQLPMPEDQETLIQILNNMRFFTTLKIAEIQMGVLVFMVNFVINFKKQESLVRCFHWIDQKGDGVLTEDELRTAMVQYEDRPLKKAKDDAASIMKKIDLNNSNDISYSQYLVAATDLKTVITDDNLERAFNIIDTDGSRKLSGQELQQKLGKQIDISYYRTLISYFDLDKDGQMSMLEFKKMMKSLLEGK